MVGKIALATASVAAVAQALPATLVARFGDSYTPYQGDGSVGAGWPSTDAWGSYEQLWDANQPLMEKSCGWNSWGADNSPDEISRIKTAIDQVAGETGVDNRFILAIVMQESKGCVRVPTTDNGVRNPGLMQSHNGSGDCTGVADCPQDQITQMIRDGTAGTSDGAGLKALLDENRPKTNGEESRATYASAREYNSGSVDLNDLNNPFTSTKCYAQDVANRLTGWTLAATGCQ